MEDLDLSFNDMLPPKMDVLFSYLRDNKKLVHLNISHNNLIEGMIGNNLAAVLDTEAKVGEYLDHFLRVNRKLVHIDLTATNLSETAMLQILPAIRKSKSIQAVHLSGNPGVTEHFKAEASTLLKTKPKGSGNRLNLQDLLDESTYKALEKVFLRESVKIKQINSGKRIVQNGATDDKFIDPVTKLILMRYLYHRDEIPGSGQWQMMTAKHEHCWLCDKEMKGFIFWCQGMETKSRKAIKIND